MGGNLTAGGTGSRTTALLPSLSPVSLAALATPKTIRTAEDGPSYEVDGKWELPRDIPETMVVECRRWLVAHEAASGVAQEGRIQNWLGRLLIGLPGKHTADDVRMKMAAFVFALNDHRAYCFDDGTLKIAMRRFMFWPSAGELIEFADEMDRWTRQTAARAQKIVDAGARVGAAVDADETDRSIRRHREKQDRERRELAAIVKQRFGEKPPLPQQEAGESASDFLDRLKAWREAPASKVEPAAAEPAAAEVPT